MIGDQKTSADMSSEFGITEYRLYNLRIANYDGNLTYECYSATGKQEIIDIVHTIWDR